MARIDVTHFSDPGCPWAYSASPAHAVLRWRYGDQLEWRLVTIGLTEDAGQYVSRGYTPARAAVGMRRFRRYGMPFSVTPRARVLATSPACRAIVAVRLAHPGREHEALRALQLAWFNSQLLLDEPEAIAQVLGGLPGIDGEAIAAAIDDGRTREAYEADRAETRTAEGGPTDFQRKARQTDGPVRYSAPSLIFETGERRLEAGGFQPAEAYDVLVANLDPSMRRREPPASPLEALAEVPGGLVTAEVAAIMAQNNERPDRDSAERALIELAAEGAVRRVPLGDDSLWRAA